MSDLTKAFGRIWRRSDGCSTYVIVRHVIGRREIFLIRIVIIASVSVCGRVNGHFAPRGAGCFRSETSQEVDAACMAADAASR
jgi:hypothetical protein